MSLISSATLPSPVRVTPQRTARCQVLDISRRGSNRCTSEAVDPLGEILVCGSHFAALLEMAGRLPGIEIILTAAEPRPVMSTP